jgi:hypothetical protein
MKRISERCRRCSDACNVDEVDVDDLGPGDIKDIEDAV